MGSEMCIRDRCWAYQSGGGSRLAGFLTTTGHSRLFYSRTLRRSTYSTYCISLPTYIDRTGQPVNIRDCFLVVLTGDKIHRSSRRDLNVVRSVSARIERGVRCTYQRMAPGAGVAEDEHVRHMVGVRVRGGDGDDTDRRQGVERGKE